MNFSKVIAALEAASAGNEHLDCEIQRLFGLMKPIPPYTRSLDAALMLVPEGWSLHRLRHQTDGRGQFTSWAVELYRAGDAMIEVATASAASSAALAICASALRVRQAEGAGDALAQHRDRLSRHTADIVSRSEKSRASA